MAYVPLIGKQYTDRSLNFNAEKTFNCYLEFSESELSVNKAKLIGTPGLETFATVTPGAGTESRALYTSSNNRFFTVVGNTLAEISNTGVVTNRGTLNTTSGPVKITDNGDVGDQLILVDGTNGYILTMSSNAFAQISDADFPNGTTHVVFQDQYFIVYEPDTFKFFTSALLDGSSWAALDFGTAEYNPDNIQALATLRSNLWVFCTNTIEVFYNSGNADFPFTRIQGAVQEFGIAAKYSVAKNNNSIFWVGSNEQGNRIVFKSVGYNAQRISDHALEFQLSEMLGIDDAIGFTYQDEGHYFYVLTFQKGNKTFAYDDSNGTWHERSWRNPVDGSDNRHRALYQTLFNQVNYVGDFADGRIHSLNLNVYTDLGDPIIRIRRAPHLIDSEKRVFYNSVQVNMEEGVGLAPVSTSQVGTITTSAGSANVSGSGTDFTTLNLGDTIEWVDDGSIIRSGEIQSITDATNLVLQENSSSVSTGASFFVVTREGVNPQMMLRWSDDGGHVFKNEHWQPIGKIGEYGTRVIWRRLGRSRDRVFEIKMSDPVKFSIMSMFAEIEQEV